MTLRDDAHELAEAWRETTGYSAPGNVGGGCLYTFMVIFTGALAVCVGVWIAQIFR